MEAVCTVEPIEYSLGFVNTLVPVVLSRWQVLSMNPEFETLPKRARQHVLFHAVAEAWEYVTRNEQGFIPVDLLYWTLGRLRSDDRLGDLIELGYAPGDSDNQ